MIELRECFLFAQEAFTARGRNPGVAENLDGDLAAKVRALGEIHNAHAAFTEQPEDSIGTNFLEGQRLYGWIVQDFVGDFGHIAVEQRGTLRVFVKQGLHVRDERFVTRTGRFEESALLGFRQIRGVVKNGLDAIPASAVHHRFLSSWCSPNISISVRDEVHERARPWRRASREAQLLRRPREVRPSPPCRGHRKSGSLPSWPGAYSSARGPGEQCRARAGLVRTTASRRRSRRTLQ